MLENLGKRIVAWLVLAAVAVLALRLVIGVAIGLVQAVLFLGIAVLALFALFWALRRA